MSSPSKPTTLRPLGPIELFSSSRHHLGIYRAVVVTCRYQLGDGQTDHHSTGTVLSSAFQTRLYAALTHVVAAQPMLRVGILGQDTNAAAFSHVSSIDLRGQVDFRGVLKSDDGSSVVSSRAEYEARLADVQGWRHNQRWENIETQPPWQVIVVEPPPGLFDVPHVDLVFGFHHSLADGTSGKLFHELLLEALRQPPSPSPSDGEEAHILTFPEPPILPEPLQDVVAYKFTTLYFLRTLWGAFGPRWLQSSKQPIWHGRAIEFSRPYVTRVIPVDITPSVLVSLLKACRAHSVSLTALLHALALASLARRLSADDDAAPAFTSSTPISMRPYLLPSTNPATRDTMRVLISSMDHHHAPSATTRVRSASSAEDLDAAVWATAARVMDELVRRTTALPQDDVVGLMKHVSDWFEFWRKTDGQPRADSWEVSNLGVLKLPPAQADAQGHMTITRVMFSNGAMVAGPVIGIGVASVAGGGLTMALSWQQDAVEENLVKGLADDLQSFTTQLDATGKLVAE